MIKSYSLKTKLADIFSHVLLTILALIWIFPIAWLVMASFSGESSPYRKSFLPETWTIKNYTRLFTDTKLFDFPRWFMNTLVIAVIVCILSTVFTLMVAYALSRLRFKGRKKFMNLTMIIGLFPGFMSMIAVYHIFKAVGLYQSKISLILIYSGGALMNYYIAKGFFDTIPRALDEAALIDGATKNQVFWKIILPISKPIVVYSALTAFIAPWADFIFVSVIMKDNYKNYTVALGLFKMLEREHIVTYFTRFCAGAVLVAIPIAILFSLMQKFYVEGVVGGSVKG